MPSFFYLLFLAGLFAKSYNLTNNQNPSQIIEAVEVRTSSPIMGEKMYRVYYIDSFVVYQSQYSFDSSVKDGDVDTTSGNVIFNLSSKGGEIRNQFFVFHKDSTFGYMYDPHGGLEHNQRQSVNDTKSRIKGTNNYENTLSMKPDSISWNVSKTELREVFATKPSKDTPAVRLILHYAKDLNHLKESFNHKLDSAKKMKFYKFEFISDAFYSEKQKQQWPVMKMSDEMKVIKVENKQEIMNYISQYKISTALKK